MEVLSIIIIIVIICIYFCINPTIISISRNNQNLLLKIVFFFLFLKLFRKDPQIEPIKKNPPWNFAYKMMALSHTKGIVFNYQERP